MYKSTQEIKKSVDIAQKTQRNYDLTKCISQEDLDTLIYAAKNSPSKQNETHYALHVFTDLDLITQIYNCTKRFGLDSPYNKNTYGESHGVFWQKEDRSIHNSQVLSNVLFVYTGDEGELRGGEHVLGKKEENSSSAKALEEQKNYSIGISIGELILSATLLGYRTGICSAFTPEIYNNVKTDGRIKVLVGIGYPNTDVDRRLHAETTNADIPEDFKTGLPSEKWRFPSFEKKCKVYFNESVYNK